MRCFQVLPAGLRLHHQTFLHEVNAICAASWQIHLTCQSLTSLLLINIATQVESAWPILPLLDLLHGVLPDTKFCVQVVVVAEADPASIRLEDREDLHVKPDPDAMSDGHANGIEIKACTSFVSNSSYCLLRQTVWACVDQAMNHHL